MFNFISSICSEQQNSAAMLWTEELEEEVQKLYDQYQTMEEKPEGVNLERFWANKLGDNLFSRGRANRYTKSNFTLNMDF
jgi:hypothetical protein